MGWLVFPVEQGSCISDCYVCINFILEYQGTFRAFLLDQKWNNHVDSNLNRGTVPGPSLIDGSTMLTGSDEDEGFRAYTAIV